MTALFKSSLHTSQAKLKKLKNLFPYYLLNQKKNIKKETKEINFTFFYDTFQSQFFYLKFLFLASKIAQKIDF